MSRGYYLGDASGPRTTAILIDRREADKLSRQLYGSDAKAWPVDGTYCEHCGAPRRGSK